MTDNVDYAKIFIALPFRGTEMYDLAEQTDSIIQDTCDIWKANALQKDYCISLCLE